VAELFRFCHIISCSLQDLTEHVCKILASNLFLPPSPASLFFWPSWALRYYHCSQIQPEGYLLLYIGACKIHGQPHKGRRACPSIEWIFIEYGEGILLVERAESDLRTQPMVTATQNQGVILFTTQNKSLSEKYLWTGICKWACRELEEKSQEWGSKQQPTISRIGYQVLTVCGWYSFLEATEVTNWKMVEPMIQIWENKAQEKKMLRQISCKNFKD
jgi:hypothetical protein